MQQTQCETQQCFLSVFPANNLDKVLDILKCNPDFFDKNVPKM